MDFPRPTNDTGIGVHSNANCYWKPGDMQSFAQTLRGHGVTWYTMWCWDENKADYCRALIEAGIEPVMRLDQAHMPNANIDPAHIQAYRNAGANWFVLGNEYNLDGEWKEGIPRDAPEKVARWYVGKADYVRSLGGWPVTPPCSPGGHINHRTFFGRFLDELTVIAVEQQRSLESILWPGGIGIHPRSMGNPLEDGPDDYDCSAREWEWFDGEILRRLGHYLPLLATEWGDEPWMIRNTNPGIQPREMWDLWTARNLEQMRWFDPNNSGYKVPSRYVCGNFWLLLDAGTWDESGLIENYTYEHQGGTRETPLWRAMPQTINWNRDDISPPPTSPYKLVDRLKQAPYGFTDLRAEIESFSDMDRLLSTQRVFGDLGVTVIHHSGNEKPHTPLDIAHWAIEQCATIDHPTIPYHFCITHDGGLYFTARMIWTTYHCYGRNKDAVGVSFVGDFTNQPPTQKAIEAGRFLLMALWEFFGQGWGKFRPMALMPHKWVVNNTTSCPGKAWRQLIWGDDEHPAVWPNLRGEE